MLSLYFHIPFCKHRCAYCDFNTYAGQESPIPAYVNALTREIEIVGVQLSNYLSTQPFDYSSKVHTVFFGGGTPSLLAPSQFKSILRAVRDHFNVLDDAEITIEANPGTVSYNDLRELRAIGINRISYGVQSANQFELRMLERAHDFFDAIRSVQWARQAGFGNLNLDLIYGLPEQTLQSWQNTLQQILDLRPEHISAYALTLEHGTPFGRWSSRGLLPIPDPDLAAEMYEYAEETLAANDYIHYEISNWAKVKPEFKNQNSEKSLDQSSSRDLPSSSFIPSLSLRASLHPSSFSCRHNLQYWRGLPYLGFGAGAHGYVNGYRYSNVLRIKTYIERLAHDPSSFSSHPSSFASPAIVNLHKQTPRDDMGEFMMTHLRLTIEGVTKSDFKSRFGVELTEIYSKEIEELIRLGLLEWKKTQKTSEVSETSEVLTLTQRGRLLGNQVFMQFI